MQVFIFGHVPPGIYERHYNRQALHWFQVTRIYYSAKNVIKT